MSFSAAAATPISASMPSSIGCLAPLVIPCAFALAIPFASAGEPLRRASQASVLNLVLALVVAVGMLVEGRDPVIGSTLVLVSFIGWVIIRYSRTCLEGEARVPRYARALLATLTSVTLLVLSNNLLVLALAWMGTSLSLHRLLTFYPERPQAVIAAHKKFLLSRFADACMLGTLAMVGAAVGSLDIDAVNAWARSHPALSPSVQVAAVLLALAVVVKSAQLPFHGWLTQVMEAPTPVSALLHAGVVNIGGFVLLRLAPLVDRAPAARTLLLVIGTTSAVVAALVMTTRVSVKVALAWSTCAQMGLMLVECGLGAWHLALVHLLAHALYKAHAFLRSGSAVDGWRVESLAPRREPVALPLSLGVAAALMAALVGLVAAARGLLGSPGRQEARLLALVPPVLLFGLSLSPLVVTAVDKGGRVALDLGRRAIGVIVLHGAWQLASSRLMADRQSPLAGTPAFTGWAVVLTGFVVLLGVNAVLLARPHGRLARALQPTLFAGLYLDELFTRWTFWLWPPRLKPRGPMRRRLPAQAEAALELGS
jgi:NAD(P)H-quinone oxidoreductase subunit 5